MSRLIYGNAIVNDPDIASIMAAMILNSSTTGTPPHATVIGDDLPSSSHTAPPRAAVSGDGLPSSSRIAPPRIGLTSTSTEVPESYPNSDPDSDPESSVSSCISSEDLYPSEDSDSELEPNHPPIANIIPVPQQPCTGAPPVDGREVQKLYNVSAGGGTGLVPTW